MLIGITGGIGSGKTTVARIIECHGFPVYYADERARWLLDHDDAVKKSIVSEFGQHILSDGKIDRQKLASLVFGNASRLEKLNSLIHPFVRKDFDYWKLLQNRPLLFAEAAIYFETGQYRNFDKMILVTAPEHLKIKRVMKRSNITEEEVRRRMAAQWTDEKKAKLADYQINNDEEISLIDQVAAIINVLQSDRRATA